jgi:hypothetical protein
VSKLVSYFRERSRLGTFENRVLRRIFGSKREEVTGGKVKGKVVPVLN